MNSVYNALKELNIQQWLLLVTVFAVIVAVITLIVIIIQKKKPKPIVTVDDENGVLFYKNIGDESAINIHTWEVTLNLFSIIFQKINLIEPKEKKRLGAKLAGRTSEAENYLEACDGFNINQFPYFDGMNIHWFTIVTKYEDLKGKKYLSVVLVRTKIKKVEHKLNGREWWIKFLNKLNLIRKLPKPPKDAHLYKSE